MEGKGGVGGWRRLGQSIKHSPAPDCELPERKPEMSVWLFACVKGQTFFQP